MGLPGSRLTGEVFFSPRTNCWVPRQNENANPGRIFSSVRPFHEPFGRRGRSPHFLRRFSGGYRHSKYYSRAKKKIKNKIPFSRRRSGRILKFKKPNLTDRMRLLLFVLHHSVPPRDGFFIAGSLSRSPADAAAADSLARRRRYYKRSDRHPLCRVRPSVSACRQLPFRLRTQIYTYTISHDDDDDDSNNNIALN